MLYLCLVLGDLKNGKLAHDLSPKDYCNSCVVTRGGVYLDGERKYFITNNLFLLLLFLGNLIHTMHLSVLEVKFRLCFY